MAIKPFNQNDSLFIQLAVASRLPQVTYATHRIGTFKANSGNNLALAAAKAYVTEPLHHFLSYGGEPGRGKTHLAVAIGWEWLALGQGTVRYWRASMLLAAQRAWYNLPNKPQKNPMDWARETGLLILDDLGAEKQSEWALEQLDDVIDHRYINGMPTVFTTNLLFSQMPPRIASRIKEGVTVLLEGPDYRETIAKTRREPT